MGDNCVYYCVLGVGLLEEGRGGGCETGECWSVGGCCVGDGGEDLKSEKEAVSMVPPLFLDVWPVHIVLDMCADEFL